MPFAFFLCSQFPWLLLCDNMMQGCHVHAIARNYGALTAQSRQSLLEDTGFSFVNCRVTGSGALYLGRAWGTFSRVVFAYTYMDNIIIPRGWYNWGDPNREMCVRPPPPIRPPPPPTDCYCHLGLPDAGRARRSPSPGTSSARRPRRHVSKPFCHSSRGG